MDLCALFAHISSVFLTVVGRGVELRYYLYILCVYFKCGR